MLIESLETCGELISDRGRDAREGERQHVIEQWGREKHTSQNSSASVLKSGQAGLDLLGKAIPELLRAIPMAQVGRVVAEGISILGSSDTGGIEVRRRPRQRRSAHGPAAIATRTTGVVVDGLWRLWSSHGGRYGTIEQVCGVRTTKSGVGQRTDSVACGT